MEGWQSLADCIALEKQRGETHRGFESYTLRQHIMIQREGLRAYLKEGQSRSTDDGDILMGGAVFILTQLTEETGGGYFYPDYPEQNWVWYSEIETFQPGTGKWWSDNKHMREAFDFDERISNPFLKFLEGCQSG